jgi:hypothetical protein
MLARLPNSQTTTAMEMTAGNTTARPATKLIRQRPNNVFFTAKS